MYTQEGNKLNFLRNKNHLFKPQRGDINIAWGSAPGNPSYDHVEYSYSESRSTIFSLAGVQTLVWQESKQRQSFYGAKTLALFLVWTDLRALPF
jgi:hypothetical protein